MFFLRDEFSLPIRISAEKYIVEYTTVFFVLFVCFLTHISLRHAHKSSSEFFWSTRFELEIFYVFGGKTSERSTTGTGNEKQRTLRKSRRTCPRLRMTFLERTDFLGGKLSLKKKKFLSFFFSRFYFNLLWHFTRKLWSKNCALFQVTWQPDAYIQSCLFRSYHK